MKASELREEAEAATFRVRQPHIDRLLALGVPGRGIAELGARQIPFGVGHVERIERGLYHPGEGALHVISPVYEGGEIIDLAAWRSDQPMNWAWRTGLGWALGADELHRDYWPGDPPLQLHATPLDWLRAGGTGMCVLDWEADELEALRGVMAIEADEWIAVRLHRALSKPRRLRDSFQSRHGGAGNAGKTLILDGGMTWRAAQISPEDAELLETRRFGVEEIARLFAVPPPIIGDYTHNTFTNSETAGRWFATFCLAPWARKIEAEFARSVFPVNGPYELEFDLSGFLRGDPETRWAAHKIAIETNVLDADEVRQIEGWNARGKKAEPSQPENEGGEND